MNIRKLCDSTALSVKNQWIVWKTVNIKKIENLIKMRFDDRWYLKNWKNLMPHSELCAWFGIRICIYVLCCTNTHLHINVHAYASVMITHCIRCVLLLPYDHPSNHLTTVYELCLSTNRKIKLNSSWTNYLSKALESWLSARIGKSKFRIYRFRKLR